MKIDMSLFFSIVAFILGVGMWLGLVYVFNYALVQENAILYDYITADFMPLYQLFNLMWSALVVIGIIGVFLKVLPKNERLYG